MQAAVVTALAGSGWRILSVANTATKEHGIDVIAELHGTRRASKSRAFRAATTQTPAVLARSRGRGRAPQAGHWFAQAVLAAMRLRGREPNWRSVIGLPDFPRYRDLHAETAGSLGAAQIEIWWVHSDGTVSWP